MKHRKPRIAWSVAWGMVAVLLIALWIFSYGRLDLYIAQLSAQKYVAAGSSNGQMLFATDRKVGYKPWTWIAVESKRSPAVFPWIEAAVSTSALSLALPNWLLASFAGALATIPWIPWSNRFSLRTLLIATTLVAVGLGLIVWAAGAR